MFRRKRNSFKEAVTKKSLADLQKIRNDILQQQIQFKHNELKINSGYRKESYYETTSNHLAALDYYRWSKQLKIKTKPKSKPNTLATANKTLKEIWTQDNIMEQLYKPGLIADIKDFSGGINTAKHEILSTMTDMEWLAFRVNEICQGVEL